MSSTHRPRMTPWLLGLALVFAAGSGAVPRAAARDADGGPGTVEREVKIGGRARSFLVHVPPSYKQGTPVPLVLNFHGGGGNAQDQQKNSKMDAVADKNGFIVAYPNGSGALRHRFLSFNAGMCCGYAIKNNVDDVSFVRAMLDDLERAYSIDRMRTYSTGFSNGAIFSHRLGCELADRIAAIGPVSGPIGIPNCSPSRPVSVLYFHGTADPAAPYEGGNKKALVGDEMHTYVSARETITGWAKRDRCQLEPQVTFRQGAVTCESYPGCAGDASVTLCTVQGGGHTWPGGETTISERTVGPRNRDVSASDMLWQFFSTHTLK
jgi:polyhydroxybutyrate depolymerase